MTEESSKIEKVKSELETRHSNLSQFRYYYEKVNHQGWFIIKLLTVAIVGYSSAGVLPYIWSIALISVTIIYANIALAQKNRGRFSKNQYLVNIIVPTVFVIIISTFLILHNVNSQKIS